jgi:protein SSD1
MQRAKYFVAGKIPEEQYRHYALNVPLYTHFTSPIRRYADIIVHRQLQSALADESTPPEEAQSLIKLAENCNFRKDAARTAQEQSIHLFLCRMLRDMTISQGPVVRCGIVVNVQSSSFDVVIPEFGIEKRVHLDQLPLVKAEFERTNRVLELFWEKGVDSMSYNPEEANARQRSTTLSGSTGNGKSHWRSDSQVEDELNLAVSSMGMDDNMALFDSPILDSPPTKALRVPAIQTNTSIQASRSAPTSPVRPPADSNTWIPGLSSESGRTASLMNVTIGESNGRPSTGGTEKEPVEELREDEGVQVIRELCRVWVVIRAEVAGEAKSGGSLTFFKAMNPFP